MLSRYRIKNRVKPRKIMIKNIWCNIKTAKFYLTYTKLVVSLQ